MTSIEADALRAREISDQLLAAERAARELASHLVALDDDSLTVVAGSVLRLMQLAELASVSLVAEAMARGVVDESSAAGPSQWVGRLAAGEDPRSLIGAAARSGSGPLVAVPDESPVQACRAASMAAVPGIDPAHAQRIVTVAGATREARNAILSTALSAGTISVSGARTAVREVDRVMAVLPGATRDQVFGHFLGLPSGASARMIRELTRRVVATYGDQRRVDGEHDRLAGQESVNFTDLPCGLVRMVADLAPDHAQRVKHALSALSAPAKPSGCCADPHHLHKESGPASERRSPTMPESDAVDERPPGRRRADALLLLIDSGARAVDADGDVVSAGGARIVVTVDHDVLVGRLGGVAVAESGGALSASTVRRLACDAEVIPMVLGTASEPLDVGRAKRLVDKGMRRAVIHRDQQCTFPACDRPPSWCDVHHVRPWWLGGGTSLSNSALLCRRHHTVVHRDGLVAAVDPSGVTWDLTAGRLPDRVTRAA